MGFTFSHPAFVLPFKYLPRRWYSVTGLVVGSMIPDLEYFIRWNSVSIYSHTLFGLLWFDLPAGLAMAVIYHQVIRNTLIHNFPEFLKSRFLPFCQTNWLTYLKKHWFIVIYSILAGAITHLCWDAFTSVNGYFVETASFYKLQLTVFDVVLTMQKIVKHITSFLAGLILIYQFFKLPKIKSKPTKTDKYYWLIFACLCFAGIAFQLFFQKHHVSFNALIKKIISSALLAVFVTSLLYRKKHAEQVVAPKTLA